LRLARSAVSGGLIVAAMSVVGATATASAAVAADGVTVWPAHAHAGERISLSVAGCSVGSVRHWASSKAFDQDVTLDGKADTGNAAAEVRKGLAPGTYAITAHCGGSHVAKGSLIVDAGAARPVAPSKSHGIAVYNAPSPSPSASPYTTISARPAAAHSSTSSSTPYWAVGAGVVVLAAAGGAFLIRRRSS
jgi:hypothetical protein